MHLELINWMANLKLNNRVLNFAFSLHNLFAWADNLSADQAVYFQSTLTEIGDIVIRKQW